MINTILVTDDNVLDNAILRNYLYPEKINFVSALNGKEALEILNQRNVDIILLDMIMPVMDGYKFLEEFSKTKHYGKIPIIVSTSLDKTDHIKDILENYEIFDYVIKPLDNINRLILVNKIWMGIKYRELLLRIEENNK